MTIIIGKNFARMTLTKLILAKVGVIYCLKTVNVKHTRARIVWFLSWCPVPCIQTVQYQIASQQRGNLNVEDSTGGIGDETDDMSADELKQLKRK